MKTENTKVLIVDDSDVIIHTLQVCLKPYQSQFEPVFARNGLEAMSMLEAHPISLVVTDIQMPVVDGLVLLAFIRERFPNMPCIVMTSYGDQELKDLVAHDIFRFLEKPVQTKQLVDAILAALSASLNKKIPPKTKRIPIREFFNLIAVKKKTCVFKLIPDDGPSCFCYFYEGDIQNAVCGGKKGEEAITTILGFGKARIVFSKPPAAKGAKSLQIDSKELLQLAKNSKLTLEVENIEKK
ncbi:MAG: response regulator [Desulfobacteraceae bacterium]|nr:MAG: response regulator [Desulfobacteraceae bacterium]